MSRQPIIAQMTWLHKPGGWARVRFGATGLPSTELQPGWEGVTPIPSPWMGEEQGGGMADSGSKHALSFYAKITLLPKQVRRR